MCKFEYFKCQFKSHNLKMSQSKSSPPNYFCIIFLFMFLVTCTKPVQIPGESIPKHTISKTNNLNFCLKPDRPSNDFVDCFGHQILQKMQDLEEREEFNLVEGVSMKRDEAGPRDISNFLDRDPKDFRSILEGASMLMSRRSMQWDMGFIYPGLNMKVGPTLTGNGLLEFVMDPRIKDRERLDGHEVSTSRLLTRQLLVPFLLGFKFQLSTLLPILFGLMVLASKKALILAKIAVIASSVFGYNSLFSGNHHGHGNGYYGGPGLSAYGNRYPGNDYLYKQSDLRDEVLDDKIDPYFVASSNHHPGQNQFNAGPAQTSDELRDRLERLFAAKHGKDRSVNNGRNFAWNE